MSKIKVLYQYLIALPVLLVETLVCATVTLLFFPWKNSWWLHQIQALWARSFCWLFLIPVRVVGTQHIRKGQSYVFVSNHQSMFDVFTIYGWLPVVFKWLMKKEIMRIPVVGAACKAAGHIAVDRGHARSATSSIKELEGELKEGVSTVIFPEGTRTQDGQIGSFKRGAFMIAWDLRLPIIPIRLDGCYEVMSRQATVVTRHPITMTILPEVDLSRYASMEEAMDDIRNMILAAG